ncbi:hypothetical protein EXS70_05250, partial [Candidatus Peribacteria bacterium]|nr:hypothetical protein [Candidatus Peribacteria bacterium]
GVCWHKNMRKWMASIGFHGKRISCGYFMNEREAAKAYDKKAIELFGEYSLTNFS